MLKTLRLKSKNVKNVLLKKNEMSTKLKRREISALYLENKIEGAKFIYMDETPLNLNMKKRRKIGEIGKYISRIGWTRY